MEVRVIADSVSIVEFENGSIGCAMTFIDKGTSILFGFGYATIRDKYVFTLFESVLDMTGCNPQSNLDSYTCFRRYLSC